MKKLYTIILVSMFALVSIKANATKHYISIGASGNAFVPSSTTGVMVGDTMEWVLVGGIHTVTSAATNPAGAASFADTMSTPAFIFLYRVTVPGNYTYYCAFHGTPTSGMMGTFVVINNAGITDPSMTSITSSYPNPCVDKIIFKYNGIDNIILYNIIGDQVKSAKVTANEGTLEVNMEDMPSGIYFYRTYKDGLVYETRKIVKTK